MKEQEYIIKSMLKASIGKKKKSASGWIWNFDVTHLAHPHLKVCCCIYEFDDLMPIWYGFTKKMKETYSEFVQYDESADYFVGCGVGKRVVTICLCGKHL